MDETGGMEGRGRRGEEGRRVRAVVLIPEEEYEEMSESEWLCAAATNPAFEFLKEPEEGIYTLADRRPFDDKGQSGNNHAARRDV